MKRPVQLVQAIIEQSEFPFDVIFENDIPDEELDEVTKTQILLTEAKNQPSEYGNSSFATFVYAVHLAIFYKKQTDGNEIDYELLLMKDFVSNKWNVIQKPPRYQDPNTGQIIQTMTVQRTMTLSDIANS
jgi:hypothetical protein